MKWRDQRFGRRKTWQALTLIELLVVIALGCVLAVLVLPSPSRPMRKSKRIQCVVNLKNIGLSFRTFSADHNDLFPMSLSVTNGGSRKWVDDPAKVWFHYFMMSNYFGNPGMLVCPSDPEGRLKAAYFATNFPAAARHRSDGDNSHVPFSGNQNVSYFVGVGADETRPEMLLAGDRNLTNREPVHFEYGKARVGNLGTNHSNVAGSTGAGWDRHIHDCAGIVANADGSVMQHTSSTLRAALRNSGDTDNRIAVPD